MTQTDIYQEIILDHYRNPRNFGEMKQDCLSVERKNPLCGDQIKLMVSIEKNIVIEDIKFIGTGCMVSIVSASVMTDEIKGKSVRDAESVMQEFFEILQHEKDTERPHIATAILAITSVITQFPVRVNCATLAWHALQDALESYRNNISP